MKKLNKLSLSLVIGSFFLHKAMLYQVGVSSLMEQVEV
ncbi:hypothetical protein CJE1049 [Campylobacter jejuni RM1221]|nr:hypothetical protein CJE1049 [Campylobacter jejuni RM1221]ADT72742.1 hypothetical protein CJS3_1016 [Campylobacter jejuni subsp. jejuni S3]EHI15999.1 hypothetical protein KW1_02980 [Campylobacter jejuni subsp. jejuni NW]EIB42345.1 hypothetical protein cje135_05037 [Campylobacter jejuni subsp. jejuni ATCC 33560]EIB89639.1 hypothetical protein cje95_06778 [Campylobacter jejuni subsp. jejuni LMG 23210]KUY34650.1 hypothetical protein K691_1545 [Campylobacter jejuni HB-CJGB-XWM]